MQIKTQLSVKIMLAILMKKMCLQKLLKFCKNAHRTMLNEDE